MNALVISLNFNPGHFSHLIANYKMFEDSGFKSHLYIHEKFRSMDEKNEFRKISRSGELSSLNNIDVAVFWFPSLRNIAEILRLRLVYKTKIVYVYHEPFDSISAYYKSGFRFKKILKICLIHLVNIPILLLSKAIILPSMSSFVLYEKKYSYLNRQFSCISLLFDDEANINVIPFKKYISYIGTVAADHAFDRFVDFVEYAIKNSAHSSLKFLIATSSAIPQQEMDKLRPHLSSNRLEIASGKPMSNSEINNFYQQSQVVWNAYNRSMQSGVLPKAYMFGSAVIVLERNANEFIDNYKTGVLIKDNNNFNEISLAIEEILGKKEYYFTNCRNKFFEKFYYKNKTKDFLALLK